MKMEKLENWQARLQAREAMIRGSSQPAEVKRSALSVLSAEWRAWQDAVEKFLNAEELVS